MKKILFIAILSSVVISSCVSPRKLEDERKRRTECEAENKTLTADNQQFKEANNELESKNTALIKQNKQLSNDTTLIGRAYRRLVVQYDKINTLNDELLSKMQAKNAMADAEARKLLADLQLLQEDLQKREDALKRNLIKQDIDKRRLDSLGLAFQQKNKRVMELEHMIAAKDSALTAFKDRLKNALLGFDGKGLSITQKDGKVYVSLSEKLLFKSGAWVVDPKGVQALTQLAEVLVKNPDINVMIEGHTDNVPYRGSNGITDNWDLSAKRSTSIVKILLKNKELDAGRVIAAGRGEFLPVTSNETKKGRAQNRRTEIILTPKWDEIFKVLEK